MNDVSYGTLRETIHILDESPGYERSAEQEISSKKSDTAFVTHPVWRITPQSPIVVLTDHPNTTSSANKGVVLGFCGYRCGSLGGYSSRAGDYCQH